jgi:uncharacterized protein (DUF433 family)
MATDLYISRNEASKLSGASATVINKAIEQRAVRTKRSKSGSMIDARDAGALQIFSALSFGLPVTMKRRMTIWLRDAEAGAELSLTDALLVRKSEASDEATARALRYVELRERFLEINPDVQGGEPVIRGTRIPIRGLAKQIEAGETIEVLRQEYDYIDPDAFEFAVLWASSNPRRGRPGRTVTTAWNAAPTARAELLEKRRRDETSAA